MANSEIALINGVVIRETEKALMIRCQLEAGDEPVSGGVWFPRSQIEDRGDAYLEMPAAVRAVLEPSRVFSMPLWLARKAGVCFGVEAV